MNINRVRTEDLEAAKRRRVADPSATPAGPASPGTRGPSPEEAPVSDPAVPSSSSPPSRCPPRRWSSSLPLPPEYERLADVFVALQQVGPLLRKRQQACTADVVCASVETMTRRRCAVDDLREVEAVRPGTIVFSVRGGKEGDASSAFRAGPISPRRVRADIVAVREIGGAAASASASASSSAAAPARAFRDAMVRLVGEIHDAFVAGLSAEDAGGEDAAVVENGSVVEWHAKFDLASVPAPGVAAERARQRETRSEKKVRRRSYELRRDELSRADADERAAASDAAAVNATATGVVSSSDNDSLDRRVGANGDAVPASWRRSASDSRDVEGAALERRAIADADAEAAKAALGDVGAELPLAAVAAVMKRRAVAAHEADPRTIEERRRRRLRDLLPVTFDVARSIFATSRRRVMAFPELLRGVVRATARESASPEETEQALRLLAESSPEWCALMPASETVSGEELWRVKTGDVAVTRFVRQKLVAMKEDKL